MKHFIGYLLILFVCGLGIYAAAVFASDHEFFHTFPIADPPKKVAVLDLPLPKKAGCFFTAEARSKKKCDEFFFEDPAMAEVDFVNEVDDEKPGRFLKCDTHFNPVFDAKGVFYPSACWAEQFGVKKYTYGVSPQMKQFMSDLWETAKYLPPESTYIRNEMIGFRFRVPDPIVSFSYNGSGSGHDVWKNGTFLRSSVWLKDNALITLDLNINTNSTYDMGIQFLPPSVHPDQKSVYGKTYESLVVFIPFEDIYPQKILKKYLRKYNSLLNKKFRLAQNVDRPIQYRFTPVFLDPLPGMKKIEATEGQMAYVDFPPDYIEKIFAEATKKIGRHNFELLVVVPILSGAGSQGSYSTATIGYSGDNLYNRQFWLSNLTSNIAPSDGGLYRNDTSVETMRSLWALQDTFRTIDHELLHMLGWQGDHFPSGDQNSWAVDPKTGKYLLPFSWRDRREPKYFCDELGIKNAVSYPVAWKLPKALRILVGSEPSWAEKIESESGPCIMPRMGNYSEMLKDLDRDGIYDEVHFVGIAGRQLKEYLGWVDTDGDGLAELVDPDPYGGLTVRKNPAFREAGTKSMSFEMLGEERKAGCLFAKIKLDNGDTGLAPLECAEFKDYLVNLYRGVKYDWIKIQKNYGTVFLPTLKSAHVK